MAALKNCEPRKAEERKKVLICYKEELFKEAYNKAVEFRKNNIVAELVYGFGGGSSGICEKKGNR